MGLPVMYFVEISIIVFLGLVLGSFSTALIYRVPRKLPWGNERSACPECKSKLGALDLLPVISWCLSMGKCRYCLHKISCKYPTIELISAALCLVVYFTFGMSAETFFIIASVPILISLFVIDMEHMILPNQLTIILFALAVVRFVYSAYLEFSMLNHYLFEYVLGAFIYGFLAWSMGALFTKILKKDALGFGDVKFFAVSGIWLGLGMLPYFLILSGSLAVLFAVIWRLVTKKEVFPFGPALIMSLYILLLFQGLKYF